MTVLIEEFDVVRATTQIEGANHLYSKEVCTIPCGEEGTVMMVYNNGEAFEVDFTLGELDGEGMPTEETKDCMVTVAAKHLELVWKYPK